MNPQLVPMIAGLGTQEVVLIVLVILLLFGAAKLPELARASGRSLRIFKAETKGLLDDDDKTDQADQSALDAKRSTSEATAETEPEKRPEEL